MSSSQGLGISTGSQLHPGCLPSQSHSATLTGRDLPRPPSLCRKWRPHGEGPSQGHSPGRDWPHPPMALNPISHHSPSPTEPPCTCPGALNLSLWPNFSGEVQLCGSSVPASAFPTPRGTPPAPALQPGQPEWIHWSAQGAQGQSRPQSNLPTLCQGQNCLPRLEE